MKCRSMLGRTLCLALAGTLAIGTSCTIHVPYNGPDPNESPTPVRVQAESAEQQQATELLSHPTQEWLNELGDEHVPTEEEMGIVYVYLAGLQAIDETNTIPPEFLAARLSDRVSALAAKYPSVFGRGQTGFAATGGLEQRLEEAPPGGCQDSCTALPAAETARDTMKYCLTGNEALRTVNNIIQFKAASLLYDVWRDFLQQFRSTGFDDAVKAALVDRLEELGANVSDGLLESPAFNQALVFEQAAIGQAAAAVFVINSAFQCAYGIGALSTAYLECLAWKETNCDPCHALGHWRIDCPATCEADSRPETIYFNVYEGDLHPGTGFLVASTTYQFQYSSFSEETCRIGELSHYSGCAPAGFTFGDSTLTWTACFETFVGVMLTSRTECPVTCSVTHLDAEPPMPQP